MPDNDNRKKKIRIQTIIAIIILRLYPKAVADDDTTTQVQLRMIRDLGNATETMYNNTPEDEWSSEQQAVHSTVDAFCTAHEGGSFADDTARGNFVDDWDLAMKSI